MLRSMLDVVIGECCHSVITVVIGWLKPYFDVLVHSGFFCCFRKILRKELPLFVKVVTGTLKKIGFSNKYTDVAAA